MLDYHLHLWPHSQSDATTTVDQVAAYCEHAAAHGVTEIAVTEHLYRFRQAMDVVGPFWEREIQVLDLTEEVHQAAEHLAEIQPGLRPLDALHAGAAHVLRKDLRPEPVSVISCDDRLLQAAAAVGLGTPIPPKAME